MSEVERLRKEITSLESKQQQHERKHAEATERRAELEERRLVLLTKIADNDQGARRELRTLDGRRQELDEDAQAFATAIASADTQLATLRNDLARSARVADIDALELELTRLAVLDGETEKALAEVKRTTDAVRAAITAVAHHLTALDPIRFDSRYEYNLISAVREAAWHRFEELSSKTTERRPSFIERVRARLENALAQLRYLNGDAVEPRMGEQLFRCITRISGLRGLELMPGNVVALRPDEAERFLTGGSLEPVEPATTTEQAA